MMRTTLAWLALVFTLAGCGENSAGRAVPYGAAEQAAELSADMGRLADRFTSSLKTCQALLSLGDIAGAGDCLNSTVNGSTTVTGKFLEGSRPRIKAHYDRVRDFLDAQRAAATGDCSAALAELAASAQQAEQAWTDTFAALENASTGTTPTTDSDPGAVSARYRDALGAVQTSCADAAEASTPAPGLAEGRAAPEQSGVSDCGRVLLGTGPDQEFPVYMRVRDISCATGQRIAGRTLFGQGAPPPDGFHCAETSSERGYCANGSQRIAYASQRSRVPGF